MLLWVSVYNFEAGFNSFCFCQVFGLNLSNEMLCSWIPPTCKEPLLHCVSSPGGDLHSKEMVWSSSETFRLGGVCSVVCMCPCSGTWLRSPSSDGHHCPGGKERTPLMRFRISIFQLAGWALAFWVFSSCNVFCFKFWIKNTGVSCTSDSYNMLPDPKESNTGVFSLGGSWKPASHARNCFCRTNEWF